MKKVFIISAIALSGLIYKSANAQIGIRVGFGFAPRRVYAPVTVAEAPQNLEENDDYYYLPEVDAYYNVYEQCYYYFDGENWVSSAYLPGEYRDYDWSNAPRYEVRAVRPYLNDDFYRNRFHGHEIMAWRGRGYGNRANEVYADRGYRNHDQHFDNRFHGGFNDQMNQREYRDGDQHFGNGHRDNFQREQPNMGGRDNREQFDNHMDDRPQPNVGGHDNREQFDNHMGDRPQPNRNEDHGNQNWGGQHFDNNRQNNYQQPNLGQRHDEQNRGGQDFQRNNNDNNQRQTAPNGGHENQNRGGGQPNHQGGRPEQRMS